MNCRQRIAAIGTWGWENKVLEVLLKVFMEGMQIKVQVHLTWSILNSEIFYIHNPVWVLSRLMSKFFSSSFVFLKPSHSQRAIRSTFLQLFYSCCSVEVCNDSSVISNQILMFFTDNIVISSSTVALSICMHIYVYISFCSYKQHISKDFTKKRRNSFLPLSPTDFIVPSKSSCSGLAFFFCCLMALCSSFSPPLQSNCTTIWDLDL